MTEGFSPWQAHQVLFLRETGTFASSGARGPALCCGIWRGSERGQPRALWKCPAFQRVNIFHARPSSHSVLAAWFTCFQRSYWRCSHCLRALPRLSGQGNGSGGAAGTCPRQPPAIPWAFRCCSSASACGWLELFKLIDVWHQCNAVCCH